MPEYYDRPPAVAAVVKDAAGEVFFQSGSLEAALVFLRCAGRAGRAGLEVWVPEKFGEGLVQLPAEDVARLQVTAGLEPAAPDSSAPRAVALDFLDARIGRLEGCLAVDRGRLADGGLSPLKEARIRQAIGQMERSLEGFVAMRAAVAAREVW